jgi:hypothetical protein
MNVSPLDVLGPVFRFLDEVIANYGVYLFLVFVWLCLILIVWILRGGLRAKHRRQNSAVVVPGVIITSRPPVESLPPVIIADLDAGSENDNDLPIG